jgi:hypothetical protein
MKIHTLLARAIGAGPATMHYEVGSSFQNVHREYLRDSFKTTDVTELKVNVAQRIGIRLAAIPTP